MTFELRCFRQSTVRRVVPLALLAALAAVPVAAQTIEVDSADPPEAEQETVNLDVTIKGSGFAKGASTHFFVTGTEDPGGITVNSSKVRGPKTIVANLDIAAGATIANYDIEVRQNGRSGKGTELFRVLEKFDGPARNFDVPVCVTFRDDPYDAITSDGQDADGDGQTDPYCKNNREKTYAHIGRAYGQFWLDTNTGNKAGAGRTHFINFSGCTDPSCSPPFPFGWVESTGWNTSRALDLYTMPEGTSAEVAMAVRFHLDDPGPEDYWAIGFGDQHPPNSIDCGDADTDPFEAQEVVVTRIDAETWTIEGTNQIACLDTVEYQGSETIVTSRGHFSFPFRLTIRVQ